MKRSVLSSVLLALGVSCIAVCNLAVERHSIAPVPVSQLGLPPEAVAPFKAFVASLPPLQIVGADSDADNTRKRVVLDSHLLRVGNGKWPWHGPQQTGDCAAMSIGGAIETDIAVRTEQDVELVWRPVNRGAIYGGGRVEIGKRAIKGAGLVPSWGLQYVDRRGILWQDEPGVPAYSGQQMDEWGRNGVPDQFLELMKPFAGLRFAACRNAQDVCNAIVAGNPVVFGSMEWGTNYIKLVEGRNVAFDTENWPHAQFISGYDGTLSNGQRLFRAINSWGPNAHSPKSQMPGDHPGGYYFGWNTMDDICHEGMVFAISGANGFRQRQFVPDFSVIGAADPMPKSQQKETAAMFPLPVSFQLPGTLFGVALIGFAVLMLFRWGNVGRRLGVAAVLAAVSLPQFAQAQMPDFGTLTQAAQPTRPVSASESEAVFDLLTMAATRSVVNAPDFAALTKAACECPCGVHGCRCHGDCEQNKRPAVKPSAAAMNKLLQSVQLDQEVGQMERPMASTNPPAETLIAELPRSAFRDWSRAPGTQGYWWHSTRRFGDTPEPGTMYQGYGVLVPITAPPLPRTAATASPHLPALPSPGHYEQRRVCNGGTCSIQNVWVP